MFVCFLNVAEREEKLQLKTFLFKNGDIGRVLKRMKGTVSFFLSGFRMKSII